MQQTDRTETIVAQAHGLLADIRRKLAEDEGTLRELGLDPAKVRSALAACLTPAQRDEADRLVKEDLLAIEHVLKQARAREQPAAGGQAGVRKKPRPLV